jgi:tRNA modification GTPase
VQADLAEFTAAYPKLPVLLVGNKQDAATPSQLIDFQQLSTLGSKLLTISAGQRQGLEGLQTALLAQVRGAGLATTGSATIVTNVRHARALEAAAEHLAAVQQGLATGRGTELLAADLRHALGALGEITGDISSDDLLTSIFTQFCIGK